MHLFVQVFADGYVPREVEFAVVEQHPTLLNVTLHPAKVGYRPSKQQRRRPVEMPPWLGGSGAGNGMGVLVTRVPPVQKVVGNRGDMGGDTNNNSSGGGANTSLTQNSLQSSVNSYPQSTTLDLEPYTFFNPGSFTPATYSPRPNNEYSSASAPFRESTFLVLLLFEVAGVLL
jgi:hypothetical protein